MSARLHNPHAKSHHRLCNNPSRRATTAVGNHSLRCRNVNLLRAASWRITGDHSPGDAEYYQLTSRLADQFDWFMPGQQPQPAEQESDLPDLEREFGLTPSELAALGLRTLSSRHVLCGPKRSVRDMGYTPKDFMEPNVIQMSAAAQRMQATNSPIGGVYTPPRAEKPYREPEGRAVYWPESERYGDPPDLPSLLLANRVIYIAMPFVPQVTELVVAQCVYLEGDEKNRNTPIYVYLNSTGCNNEQGQALSNDYEFFAMWSALGFTRAPIYTGCIGYAKNAAGILLSSGVKGHRYSWPHAQISLTPPVLNRVFGDTVDAQIQNNQLERVTKMYASILSKATGKTPQQALDQYLTRKRHFDVKSAIDEGIIDKVLPGYMISPRFRQLATQMLDKKVDSQGGRPGTKPQFKFRRDQQGGGRM